MRKEKFLSFWAIDLPNLKHGIRIALIVFDKILFNPKSLALLFNPKFYVVLHVRKKESRHIKVSCIVEIKDKNVTQSISTFPFPTSKPQ